MKTEKKPLSIYVHIPFCERKCLYCDFLSAPADEELKQKYVSCLTEEIRQSSTSFRAYEVQTVFFGGGTPSILPAEKIAALLKEIRQDFAVNQDAEISIEVNPGSAEPKKLRSYADMGINRLSIGLQSAIDEELTALGRIHSAEDFFETYKNAVKSGFNNINVDLMSSIPGQTIKSYRKTLKRVLSLEPLPTHISAYSLIIEEGTPFYENTPELPDEETDRELYKITNDILKEAGYHRYEISNYAREGYECRHNKVYWKRGEYLGFGTGAASLVDEVRFSNIRDINDYVKTRDFAKVRTDRQVLSVKEQMEEFMFLGLRMISGVSFGEFEKNFDKTMEEVYPGVINKLKNQGLLKDVFDEKRNRTGVCLTQLGLDVCNRVMAEFLFD